MTHNIADILEEQRNMSHLKIIVFSPMYISGLGRHLQCIVSTLAGEVCFSPNIRQRLKRITTPSEYECSSAH
jgi:hypothetical protein